LELELSQIFPCPHCRMETPHYVMARRNQRVGIICSQCETISLVRQNELEQHQAWWEDELSQILSNLDEKKHEPDSE